MGYEGERSREKEKARSARKGDPRRTGFHGSAGLANPGQAGNRKEKFMTQKKRRNAFQRIDGTPRENVPGRKK